MRAAGLLYVLQEREDHTSGAPEALLQAARAQLLAGGGQALAERRDGADLLLTVRAEGRRFRVRIRASPPLVWVATAGPEGLDDPSAERFLGSLRQE